MPKTMFQITFRAQGGSVLTHLDTTDQAKIGPWLAEMYGLYPYGIHDYPQVDIQTTAARS